MFIYQQGPKTHTLKTFLKRKKIKKSGCWDFTGSISAYGYGCIGYKGKVMQAHRLSWILHYGEISNGLLVCHKCDNRKCVNPDHLFLGTYKDNTNDMITKGRHVKRGQKKDLPLVGSNTMDKRLTFTLDQIKQINIASAYSGLNAKNFMEQSVIAATIMTIAKIKN